MQDLNLRPREYERDRRYRCSSPLFAICEQWKPRKVLNHKEATKVYARLMVAPVCNAIEEATSAMRRIGEL